MTPQNGTGTYPLHFGAHWSPRRGWRKWLLRFIRIGLHCCFRVEYVGKENLPSEGPLILAANHTSGWDAFAINQCPNFWIHWVGKKELIRFPLWRGVFALLGMIPVDRDRLDLRTAKMMLQCLSSGSVIGIFPEGTRVPEGADRSQYPPKSGVIHFALKEGVPLLPVAVEGRFRLFSHVRIHYGKPYYLEHEGQLTKEKSQILVNDLMDRIYSLYEPKTQSVQSTGEKADVY